jgi:hypothetical protein
MKSGTTFTISQSPKPDNEGANEISNVTCLIHKHYDGSTLPPTSCKNCCKIYVDKLKVENLKNNNIFSRDRQKIILEKRIKKRSG